MNISFDLDLTLIPYNNEFDTEPRSFIAKLFGIEKIRKGAPNLIKRLKQQGHSIYIYTTSYRNPGKITQTLKYYGIRVDQIITEPLNRKTLKTLNINASKHPPAFDIDLHIDDSLGVKKEAETFGFNVVIVSLNNDRWVDTTYHSIINYTN